MTTITLGLNTTIKIVYHNNRTRFVEVMTGPIDKDFFEKASDERLGKFARSLIEQNLGHKDYSGLIIKEAKWDDFRQKDMTQYCNDLFKKHGVNDLTVSSALSAAKRNVQLHIDQYYECMRGNERMKEHFRIYKETGMLTYNSSQVNQYPLTTDKCFKVMINPKDVIFTTKATGALPFDLYP